MGLLATLTRSTGVLLLVPMAYYYYERRGWRLRRTDAHVANLLMVAEGMLVWMTYLSLAFGKPLLFSTLRRSGSVASPSPTTPWRAPSSPLVWGLRKVVSAEFYKVFWEVPRPGSAYSTASANLINMVFLVAPPCCSGTAPGGCRAPTPGTPWLRSPTRSSSPRSTCR